MSTSPTPRALWEQLHPLLDPQQPAGGDSRFRRIDRPYSPLEGLVTELRRPLGRHRKELLYGPPGSGKTTELLALLPRLYDVRTPVFLDLLRHFQDQRGDRAALDHLHPWELLSLIGLTVYQTGLHAGVRWTPDETEALRGALAEPGQAAQVDVGALAKELALTLVKVLPGGSVGLELVAAVAGAASVQLPLGLPDRLLLPDQDSRVQRLRQAVTALILRFERENPGRKLLVVVDGLDRSNDAGVAQRLFVDSGLLADLPCDLVICVSPELPVRNVRGFRPLPITTLPVLRREDAPNPNPPGLEFFWALWQDRLHAAGVEAELASPARIERLAWASGGLVREFLNMARDALGLAWDEDSVMTSDHVERVIDQWRRRWEEGLNTTQLRRLRAVMTELRPDDSDTDRELMHHRCILAYPNDSMWYFPHPLLTLKLLR